MATAKEVLALVITGDGRGAITELEKVGSAAEREIGRSQTSIDKLSSRMTTWGATAVAGGAVAAAGLYTAAMAAGQLETNIARIEGNLGSASGAAIDFVRDANGIGLSDQAAAQYVANIGELAVGLGIGQEQAAGMTVETVKLIAQLSSLKGVSTADGLDAVQSGLIGEYDALQRLVPSINAAAIEERALADTRKESASDLTQAEKAVATFAIVNESATATLGRSADASETTAGRNARLAASYQDMQTALGEGALPVLEKVVGVLTSAGEAFSDADDATGGLLSTLVTVATVGALAGGGLSFVVGQGIKLHSTVTDLGGALRTTEGDLTRTGRAAQGVGIALAGLAAIQIGDQIRSSLAGEAGRLETARKELEVALANGSTDSILSAFSERAGAQADNFFTEIPQVFGKNLKIMPDLASETIEDIEAAFEELSIDDQSAVLEALKAYGSGLKEGSQEAADNAGLIDNLTGRYDLNRAATDAAARSNDGFADSAGAAGSEAASASGSLDLMAYAYDRTTGAGEKATSGAKAYVEALQGAFDPILGLLDANERLADAEEKLAEAADTNSKEIVQANRNLADARRRVEDATRNLTDAQAELNDVLADDPMFGLRSVSPEEEIADARTRLAEANRLLAENPGNAMALTMRDTAVLDLEDASRRQQDERRNGEQRAEDIANAQRAVEDAQRGLADANQGVVDAQGQLAEVQSQHGLNSDEYARAAQEVIEANLGVQAADAELAQWMRDNGIEAVGELNGKLDEWIARGGPVGEAAATMKAQIAPLVEQALIWAGTLGGVTSAYDVLIGRMALFAITAGQAAGAAAAAGAGRIAGAIGVGGPPQNVPVDQFGIPLYGRPGAATGGLVMGDGTGTSDDVDARLSNGEFVLRASTTAAIGPAMLAQVNQTGRLPQIVREQPSSSSTVRSEGDLIIDGVQIVQHVSDDGLAGAAAVGALRDVARRSGRGLRASSKLVA